MSALREEAPRTVARATREHRLRVRIDGLLEQRSRKERRILELESLLRIDGGEERIEALERRLQLANERLAELSRELWEARRAA